MLVLSMAHVAVRVEETGVAVAPETCIEPPHYPGIVLPQSLQSVLGEYLNIFCYNPGEIP